VHENYILYYRIELLISPVVISEVVPSLSKCFMTYRLYRVRQKSSPLKFFGCFLSDRLEF